jgi:hypothetical protein
MDFFATRYIASRPPGKILEIKKLKKPGYFLGILSHLFFA